jgi:hypothetical protein
MTARCREDRDPVHIGEVSRRALPAKQWRCNVPDENLGSEVRRDHEEGD